MLQQQKEATEQIRLMTDLVKAMEEKVAEAERKLSDLEKNRAADREAVTAAISTSNAALATGVQGQMELVRAGIKDNMDVVVGTVKTLSDVNSAKIGEMKTDLNRNLTEIRQNTEKSLKDVREDNEKQLSEMRKVVEDKLTGTLNERLNQTFGQINERLDAVNKGLGEMQALSGSVTDLKKVLGNVKTRGMWGEVSLENLLDGILTREQYVIQQNVSGKKNAERVDFAVVLPGSKGNDKVYLPIDVKFPIEDYQRLVETSEQGDKERADAYAKALVDAVKTQAKSISDKYLNPPHTTDFAVMYLPIEGLYAEIVRNPGLVEELQSKYKILPAGPTTISALLNSLQMGFKTLAIQKSSREVFNLLAAFRKDFGKYVSDIERAQKNAEGVNKALEEASKRNDMIMKKLDKVEKMDVPDPDLTIGIGGGTEGL
ncbi:MAG: DNA recombination protein RmuC [Clostridia bacterium]|nr:DNA recombination protein RmuC [Clostridia bacterium]